MQFNPKQLVIDIEAGKDESFQNFLDASTTKFMLSVLPPGPPDALQSLLRAAFEAGLGYGAATTSVGLLKVIMESQKK